MELKVQTEIGEMTAILISDTLSGGYSAYFKEKDNVIAEGDDVTEAIENLHKILKLVLEVEEEIKTEEN